MKPTDQNIENALKEAGIVIGIGLVRWVDIVADLINNEDWEGLNSMEVEVNETDSAMRQLVSSSQVKLLKSIKQYRNKK